MYQVTTIQPEQQKLEQESHYKESELRQKEKISKKFVSINLGQQTRSVKAIQKSNGKGSHTPTLRQRETRARGRRVTGQSKRGATGFGRWA